MPQKYPVKHYLHTMGGAPTIQDGYGDLTNCLDACLINGFNLRTASGFTVVNGVGTIAFATAHGYGVDQIILVSGCVEADLNDEFRVVSATEKTVTVEGLSTSINKSATTNTQILVKVAPQGSWEIAFTALNIRVYRSKSPNSSKPYIRVDDSKWTGYTDTWARFARVSIHETMTDAMTTTGAQAPYRVDYPRANFERPAGTNYWGWWRWIYSQNSISFNTNSTAIKYWSVVADSRFFYFQCDTGYGGGNVYYTGEFFSFKQGDAYNCLLRANDLFYTQLDGRSTDPSINCNSLQSNTFTGGIILKDWLVPGNPASFGLCPIATNNSNQLSGRSMDVPYPNGPNYGLMTCPTYLRQGDGHIRGIMPGMRWLMQRPYLARYQKIQGLVGEPNRKFIHLPQGWSGESDSAGCLVDITGPWVGNEDG